MSNAPPPPPPPGAAAPPPPPAGGGNWQPQQGNTKADAKAAKAYHKASRPWFKKKRFILGGLLLVIIVAVVATAGGGDGDKSDETDKSGNSGIDSVNAAGSSDAANDVKMKSCANDDVLSIGQPVVTITNNSSKRSSYTVTVTVETDDGKTQVDTAIGSAQSLEPDQSTDVETFMGEAIPEGATCRVTDVTRFAS